MNNILVISNAAVTPGYQKSLESFMRQCGFPMFNLRWETSLSRDCYSAPNIVNPAMKRMLLQRIQSCIIRHIPSVIIIQDKAALQFICEKKLSLGIARGGVYHFNGIPCIVINDMRTERGFPILSAIPYADFLFRRDLKKVMRYYENKVAAAPSFEFEICDTLAKVRAFQHESSVATYMGLDTETCGTGPLASISCASWACLMPNGNVKTYVVPLLDPNQPQGALWSGSELAMVLATIRDVNASSIPKGLQNGSYDACYYIRTRIPLRNWIVDTAVAFHSLYPEIPKRIDFIASITCDRYRYWKDEGKEDEKDDNKGGALPRTPEGWAKYLRYNALDSYYIVPITLWELRALSGTPWAMENYRQSMRQVLGPAIAMSMRGVPVNTDIQAALSHTWDTEGSTAYRDLKVAVANPNFNPNSPPQVAQLIYDILKASPLPRKGKKPKQKKDGSYAESRPTDENTLRIIQTQHPFFASIITRIWDTKKPGNNKAKYGVPYRDDKNKWHGLRLWPGSNRWLYKLNPVATETGRYGSKKHDFWMGQQIQNPTPEVRPMVEAPPGFLIWKADLSKADFFHTAYASEEPNMMDIVQREVRGELDVHCQHAAQFFSKPYALIHAGYKNKEDWVVHSTKGVRQNTKRIVYGANYLMAGNTLLVGIMGKEAVDATAAFMGHSRVGWSIKDYANFCQSLIDYYFQKMYPGLQPWLERTIRYAATHGNRITCCGGRTRTFFADLLRSNAAQRELAAFFGQGGTAGTINAGLDEIYYRGIDSSECMVLWQLHDELGGLVREDRLELLEDVRSALLVTNHIHGRDFIIPVEIEVGRGWGARMTSWSLGKTTIDDINKAESKWQTKNQDWLHAAHASSSSLATLDPEKILSLII